MDHNEAACGACRRIGELICCEGCVAAFHWRCAGYDSASEVPGGDWYCWFCAKKKGREFQHPTTLFKSPRSSQTHVMLAVDEDKLDKFYRCQVLAASEGYVELSFIDLEREAEVVHRKSLRLWHGTIDKNAWSIETDGVTWRPNSRLFEIDTEAMVTTKTPAAKPQQHAKSSKDSKPHVKSGGGSNQRVPEGQVGAGLPVIHGGAGEEEFMAALNKLWKGLLGSSYPDQMPQCLLVPGHCVNPWHLWREVWSWGGPDAITENKLWATIGFSFDVPWTSSAASSRVKRPYDQLIAPLDQAIDVGDVVLQRPPRCRQLKHRALQIRPPLVPVTYGSSGAAVKRTGSGQAKQEHKKKRKRGGWSSSDDEVAADSDSDDEDPVGSGYQGDSDRSGSAEVDDDDDQGDERDGDDDDREEGSSDEAQSGGEGDRGTPPAKRAKHAAGAKATAAATSGGVRPRLQPTDSEVMARINLSAAAQNIKVGHVVDFRQIQRTDKCVTGWRCGVVLAIEPGSAWEGGRKLLIRPRHHQHHRNSNQQEPKPPVGSPAATALAAVTAAGCEGGTAAAQKLLTASGHVRREVAGLIATPKVPAVPAGKKDAAGADVSAHTAGGGETTTTVAGEESDDGPTWVPFVWRGSFSQPFPRPVVMVRPHYRPAPAAGQLISTGSSSLLSAGSLQKQPSMERQQSVSSTQTAGTACQLPQLAVGAAVEVLRQGSWWPAQIMAVKGSGKDVEGGSQVSISPQVSLSASGGATVSQGSGCVVLRNDDPPEADGAVWRCSREHAIRAAHPQKGSWYGMLLSKREDMLPLPVLRKQLQPYIYAGGIQAFACLHHMIPEFGRE